MWPGTGLHMIRRDLASDVCCTLASADGMRTIPPLPIHPQNNYPETLGKTLIINAPSMFAVLFKAVKPMLDARTQAKIKVCSSSYLSELRKYVDDENIPSYLGGRIISVGVWELHQTIRKGFMPWALCIAASCRGS